MDASIGGELGRAGGRIRTRGAQGVIWWWRRQLLVTGATAVTMFDGGGAREERRRFLAPWHDSFGSGVEEGPAELVGFSTELG